MKYYTLEERLTKMSFKDYLDEIKENVVENKGQEFYDKALSRYCHSMKQEINEISEYEFLEFINMLGSMNRIGNNMEYLKYYGFDQE